MTVIREYKHGEYTAKLYGESSMSIYKNNKEVLHTGSRACNTKEEVIEVLKGMPKLEKMFKEIESDPNWENEDI